MYLVGKGHTHWGPGTSFVQRIDWTRQQENGLERLAGMGCGSCGGNCGRCKQGLGLFDSMDFTTWGLGEWALVGIGAYLVLSIAGDTRRVASSVSRKSRGVRKALKA